LYVKINLKNVSLPTILLKLNIKPDEKRSKAH
jgi:hypothetical protein